MKKFLYLFFFLPIFGYAQISDNFESGNINSWTESTAGHWAASATSPINGTYSLQQIFNNTIAGTDQISIPFGSIDLNAGTTTWRFQIKYGYNPSGSNNWGVFLISDKDAVDMHPGATVNGYVVGVDFTSSTSDDLVKLWKVTNGSTSVVTASTLNWQTTVGTTTPAGFEITRTAAGLWDIKVDANGGFDNLVSYVTPTTETTFTTSNYFGLYYCYTSSADQLLWMDDVSVTGSLGNNHDSFVSAGTAPEPTIISSLINTQAGALQTLDFQLTDAQSGDLKPTIINSLSIKQGTENTVTDWTNAIAGAVLTGPDISGELLGTITPTSIDFSGAGFINIADGTSETYNFKIWLKPDLALISDNDKLAFRLSFSDISCDASGSSFGSGVAESGAETVQITAEKLSFSSVPTTVSPAQNFSITVKATDINGNLDTDYSGLITLSLASGSGILNSQSGLSQNAASGILTINDLQYSAIDNFTINAASSGLTPAISASIASENTVTCINEDFESGTLTNWTQSVAGHWEASNVNPLDGLYSLHESFDNSASGIEQISIPICQTDLSTGTTTWQFQLKHGYSESSSNNWACFLMSDVDATSVPQNAYILGVDYTGSNNTLTLWKTVNGSISELINTGFSWSTNVGIAGHGGIKVVRTGTGEWSVFVDAAGGFDNLVQVGNSVIDTDISGGQYLGFYYKYSSAQDLKLWIDDLSLKMPPDVLPPSVLSADAVTNNKIRIKFNENVDATTAQNISNYSVDNSVGNPTGALLNPADNSIVDLTFAGTFTENTNYQISLQNIKDVSGNPMTLQTHAFQWISPKALSIKVLNNTSVDVAFSKDLDITTAQNINNYSVNNSIGNPITATLDAVDTKIVHLIFANTFTNKTNYTLSLSNIQDIFGNVIVNQNVNFTYYVPQIFDVVINEIMFDVTSPAPVALPAQKYIELYNNTVYDVNLENWTLTIGTNSPKTFPQTTLPAHGYLIICDDIAVSQMSPYGLTAGILDPTQLTSTVGKEIQLKMSDGTLIEDLTYSPNWYQDPNKDNGGWSIERIDPMNFCGETQNWHVTNDYTGGTPGRINSIYAINPDNVKPTVLNAKLVSARQIQLTFSKKIDAVSGINPANYILNGTINPSSMSFNPGSFSVINIFFAQNLTIGDNTFSVNNVLDNCSNTNVPFSTVLNYKLVYPQTVSVMSKNQLIVKFSEAVDAVTASAVSNYFVNHGIGNPTVATVSPGDSTEVNLLFAVDFTEAVYNTISIQNVKDIYANQMAAANLDFAFYTPKAFDIVFNEIMCDINPAPVALPPNQYLELYNTTDFDINMNQWKFTAEGQSDRRFPDITLPRHSYLILCESSNVSLFSQYGQTVGILSSSDLTISGKKLQLFDNNFNLIEYISYSSSWYNNPDHGSGGWSLERIDPMNFCGTADNWSSSVDISGGTPGRLNSIYKANPNTVIPSVDSIKIVSSNHIKIYFSKNIKLSTLDQLSDFSINNSVGSPAKAQFDTDSYSEISIFFSNQFTDGTEYQFHIQNIADNCENEMAAKDFNFTYHLLNVEKFWITDSKHFTIQFSEQVDKMSALTLANYTCNNGIGNPESVVINAADSSLVLMQFATAFQSGVQQTLHLANIKDVNGNVILPVDLNSTFYIPKAFDVVINEIMCDINPVPAGLPPFHYVELYNTSNYDINLNGWGWQAEGQTRKTFTNATIASHNFLILCENSHVSDFQPYGNAIGILGSSDLTISGKKLMIFAADSTIMESVAYSNTWYHNIDRQDGGWSLERIDPTNFCGTADNWAASVDIAGGTPGKINSKYAANPNTVLPTVDSVAVISSNHLIIYLTKNIAQNDLAQFADFSIDNSIGNASAADFENNNQAVISVYFANQFSDGVAYLFSIQNLADNCGNIMMPKDFQFTYHKISPKTLYVIDSRHLLIKFSETADKVSASDIANYYGNNNVDLPESCVRDAADSSCVHLQFAADFPVGVPVTLHITNVKDVNGNSISPVDMEFTFYIPQPGDIVINEVLFNPLTGGTDFVELYNRSGQKIDLINFKLATRDTSGAISSLDPISPTDFEMKPTDYLAFSKSKLLTLRDYQTPNPAGIIEIPSMPSYNNDAGDVVLVYMEDTVVIDELKYSQDMQFQMLRSFKGVSLERVNYDVAASDPSNWHSASSEIGYGTPAYKNSQYRDKTSAVETGSIAVNPELFSPDNDGKDDVAFINYKFDDTGFVANISIYNSDGYPVRQLAKNILLSAQGSVAWDGLDDNKTKVRAGIYIVYFEVFDLKGNVHKFQKTVVSAVKL